ncbi:uncharacterized protein TrAFT101_003380 [Trichoderma asperellum]|uniref:Uncharacterized protein n=1 Tax=Trichoderma asperellum (strain ATCC 204424 / CBS 433.97 / NBRC 101777) TaxID=1042311 RepID=A0A2T3ZQV2_TRIA4|nr:hypothetical protein M441DRAFT_233020 [Trichoderma asperellum CBS 433.97]PTB47186.1 hypothetical protein M441DRAFT_233020 [Trichoderma asperellum CBS 433.97]UKZ87593.1 hypothetical protein TrAFT101_003380 [Trichoderma asperellum]
MSDTSPNGPGTGHRRSSITQAALSNLFSRGPSNAPAGPPFPNGNGNADAQRRRLSITTIGLSGTSPTDTTSFMRRGSMSTNSDSINENAIEDEDAMFGGPRTAPTTPFARHMSFGGNAAMRTFRNGSSPGNDQYGFNWSEQLRSRAESSVTGSRPSFSFQGTGSHSPPRAMPNHDRSKSISDMPQPPAQASAVKPKQPERPKPDAFQERILKGDFYMD